MDYFTLLSQQPQEKAALITEEKLYTYGDLCSQAQLIRGQQENFSQPVKFIHAEHIAGQLIQFIAYSGSKTVPVIATEASKKQEFIIDAIPDRACMGVLTSGSTGNSKLLWRSYESWVDFFPQQNEIFGIDGQTIIFCQGSLAFTGNLNIYMSVLAVGGTIVAAEKFRPKHWLQMIEKYHVNALYLIPSKLLLLPKVAKNANNRIKCIVSGSQSLGRKEAERLRKIFPHAEITLYYGASELNYITYIKGSEMTEDRTKIGRPFPGVKIAVEQEEIFVDTPFSIEGIARPFSLKDRGYLDENGCLHFLGRVDDICNLNGIKVSMRKVEQILQEVSFVTEASVLPLHRNDADSLIAFLAAGKHCCKQEMIMLLKDKLTEYEIPKQFIFLSELPKNESGKIDKRKLALQLE